MSYSRQFSEKHLEMEKLFSFKRYFMNNADSYHGMCVLSEVSKILAKNAIPPSVSDTVVGEDAPPRPPLPPEFPYEIYATVVNEKDPQTEKKKGMENVAKILSKDKKLVQTLLTCGTVILDISYDREEVHTAMEYLKLLKALLERQLESMGLKPDDADANDDAGGESKKRYLILISTVMSWAATKPLDPENPEMAFIESDFRKRKPHPNYKDYYDVENEVIGIARKYKSQIGAIVVCTGVTYGGKEDVLYYWFQKAWECEKFLPIIGRGGNAVPLINVLDLAQIVYNLISDFPKKLYILAVEQNITKQREIVKPLGRIVGSGMFKCLPPEDAFLVKELDQRIFDLFTINLNMEPTFIVETMGLEWTSELTFGENIPALIKQFKKERGLKPYKVVIYGPPLVGKTSLAKQICERYGLLYVSPETIAADMTEELGWRVQHWNTQGETAALGIAGGEDDDVTASMEDIADEEAVQETARNTLAMLRSGRPLGEEEIISFLRQRLLGHEALNKGWVLDGFPTNLIQCATLFERGDETDSVAEEDNEDEQFEEDAELYSNVLKKILPDIVVSLEATDDFICEKAMRQPQGDSYLEEEIILKRLSEFRVGDTRDLTPLNFFDELDIHPLVVPVKDHNDYAMQKPYANVALRMGRPCRYPKLLALTEEAEKKEAQEIKSLRTKEEQILKEMEKKMQEEREDKMEYWSELYALLREEEEAALAAAGEPMRNYLVHHIFPTLTPALLEVAKLRPEDPIDFLAEYLFKLNPNGKMLEPGFNLQAEKMLGRIKLLDDALKNLEIKIDPLIPSDAEVEEEKKHVINPMSAL
ncbi:adenylate kinase 7-like [Hyposmocoma kahamanoa]|uniref:adenylate kinase 7-like n=1 Tax=Hyposmocoma kahamanoa TaxID=1477025 RepID=UPI000E6D641E|nr:adenylate kinase 7-like [Hyposmocoma kahamanoa]